MAKIIQYLPETPHKLICDRGNCHQSQALNLVCLDPICRQNPLICSVCFASLHKYHRVVGLDKFLSDYASNVRRFDNPYLLGKIEKHSEMVAGFFEEFRADINKQLDEFQRSISQYSQFLLQGIDYRHIIAQNNQVMLEESELRKTLNHGDLNRSITFILQNSLFDSNRNMVNIADLLKQNEMRMTALLDKMINQTEAAQRIIHKAMKTLQFPNETLKSEHIRINQASKQLKGHNRDPFNPRQFLKIQQSRKTIQDEAKYSFLTESKLRDPVHDTTRMQTFYQNEQEVEEDPCYMFSKYRHEKLQVTNNARVMRSEVSALKPQFGVVCPNLNLQPQKAREWSLRINNCRNLACQNTMGVGVSSLPCLKLSNYEGSEPPNSLIVTSQGWVLQNGTAKKTDFIYGAGDVLHFKYDPFYNMLEINKANGRKLSLSTQFATKQPLYICTRLTYASDEVQLV